MKVKEVIEALKKLDQELPVFVRHANKDMTEVRRVRQSTIFDDDVVMLDAPGTF